MPRISIGDGLLYYERHGTGFPILLVTGLSGHAQFWRDQLPAFAKSFEIITHDLRGFGQSDPPPFGFTVERSAGDVIGLMDALRIEKAHIIGHSAGGAMAQVLAIEHPQRVASIVLAATWAKADAYFRRLFGLRKEILLRLGAAAFVQTNSLLFYPSQYIARNNEKLRQVEAQSLALLASPETIVNRIDALLAFDRSEDLARVRTPALVMATQDDLVTPAYFAEELARRIPGAEAKFFAQGGHYFTQILAREFNQAVLPFLIAHTPDQPETSR
jgi:aminoacrylate hydrolase